MIYPRRLYTDSSGNCVELRCQQAENAAGFNASGRTTAMDDVRSNANYIFDYTEAAPAVAVSVNAATNRVVGLGYDNNGNQTSWATPLGPVTAAYDVDNRLASISTPNGSEVYAYSAVDQRLRKQGKLYFYGVGGELLVEYDFAYGGGGTTPLNPKTQVYFGGMLVFGEGDRRITTDRLASAVRTEGYFQPE